MKAMREDAAEIRRREDELATRNRLRAEAEEMLDTDRKIQAMRRAGRTAFAEYLEARGDLQEVLQKSPRLARALAEDKGWC